MYEDDKRDRGGMPSPRKPPTPREYGADGNTLVKGAKAQRRESGAASVQTATKANAFNSAEQMDEERACEQKRKQEAVVEELTRKFPAVARQAKATAPSKASSARMAEREQGRLALEYPYDLKQVKRLLEAFGKPTPAVLRQDCLEELLRRFETEYATHNPQAIGHLALPENGRVVVVGDTHGQLNDLLWIFAKQGFPSAKTAYLFNGDIADRGPNAVPMFILIYLFFLLHPKCVIINRGNHEDVSMNQISREDGGGFYGEVLQNYEPHVYELFVRTFRRLLLATVLNKEVFVVHGGLPRMNAVTLEYIRRLPWTEYTTPTCTPNDSQSKAMMAQNFLDLLWSDPSEGLGKFPSRRGAGILFGVDVTASFLKVNQLKMLIRSHQCPADNHGYFVHHQGLCLTVFSASNYCGEVGNWGAVVCFDSNRWPQYGIHEYWSPDITAVAKELQNAVKSDHDMKRARTVAELESLDSVENELRNEKLGANSGLGRAVLNKMMISIIMQKPGLWTACTERDEAGTTKLPLDEFIEVVQLFCGTLPWERALNEWGEVDNDPDRGPLVDYDEFLSRFRVELAECFKSWKSEAVKDAFSALVYRDQSIDATLRMIDKNGDGDVTRDEFRQFLEKLNLDISGDQLEALLVHCGFRNKNSRIDANEFLSRFALTHNMENEMTGRAVVSDPWAEIALQKFAAFMMKHHATDQKASKKKRKDAPDTGANEMLKAFKDLDKNGDGQLEMHEFVAGAQKLPGFDQLLIEGKMLDEEGLQRIAKVLDVSGDGTVNYLEFLTKFSVNDTQQDALTNSLTEHISTTLFRNRAMILAAAKFFDPGLGGHIGPDEFAECLGAVNSVLTAPQQPFTPGQVSKLVAACTGDDGRVDYHNLLDSFEIVDGKQADDTGHAVTMMHRCTLKKEVDTGP